jgi:DNA transformation protein and related proteins
MSTSNEFLIYIADQFSIFRPVQIRGMFGGSGIFCDGIMFGLIADDTVYLKSGVENLGDFEQENMPPFTYEGKNKPIQMSYHRLPDQVLETPEELAQWAQKAFSIARAAKIKKSARKKNT